MKRARAKVMSIVGSILLVVVSFFWLPLTGLILLVMKRKEGEDQAS